MSHDSAPDAESNVCGERDGVSATVNANKREEKEKKKKRMKKRRMTCPLRPAALWGELRGVKERESEMTLNCCAARFHGDTACTHFPTRGVVTLQSFLR